jgi:hypothetical protein
VDRWILRTDATAESGSNAGSDFQILARADAGSALSTPLTITRATGAVLVTSGAATTIPLTVKGAASQSGDLQRWANSSNTVLANIDANGVIASSAGQSSPNLKSYADGLTTIKFDAWRNVTFGSGTSSNYGAGRSIVAVSDATLLPTTTPSGGIILWSDAGVLKWKGTSGTVYDLSASGGGGGGFVGVAPIASKTGNYTLTGSDYTITADTSAGSFTVTLPAAAAASGQVYNIKKVDSSSNTVTVAGDGAETVDGSNTQVIAVQYASLQVQSNGYEWWIL